MKKTSSKDENTQSDKYIIKKISVAGLKFGIYKQMPHGLRLVAAAVDARRADRIADMLNGE